MAPFLTGISLAQRYFDEIVQPIVRDAYPALRYAAALIGDGSEVLGFDTPMSADHDFGPRLHLFIDDDALLHDGDAINAVFEARLPAEYLGYATRFATTSDATMRHHIRVTTLNTFTRAHLDIDIAGALTAADWLTLPQQKLRSLTAGAVFRDDIGLAELRATFTWYPRDVWLYLLASGWTCIGQELHLAARAGDVGDELGSALIAARLVRVLMQLCFLIAREYAPYPKWFGSAFAALPNAAVLTPLLQAAHTAATWRERQAHLLSACEQIAIAQNALGICSAVRPEARQFHTRPFTVFNADEFCAAACAAITDLAVRALTQRRLIGSIDQFCDNTDLREDETRRGVLRDLY
jgi:hypothetical protein